MPLEIQCSFKDKDNKKIIWFKKGYEEVIIDHQEVVDDFQNVKMAIENPHTITKDVDYKNRRCHYLFFCRKGSNTDRTMKVVIRKKLHFFRDVVTAYYTNNIKQGEQTIWTRLANN